MQGDQTYDRERRNLTEEEEMSAVGEEEIEAETVKDADEGDDEDDTDMARDTQGN
jgi:hypothetical protein